MKKCKNCKWLYKKHCANGISDNVTEWVDGDNTCEKWEGREEPSEESEDKMCQGAEDS